MSNSVRCDHALFERGLAPSGSRAQALIKAGSVFLNGVQVEKCSVRVEENDVLEIRGEVCPYVSRGGLKLAKALEAFEFDPKGLVCLDVGASTGGFTDVLLQNGASLVYALDVGTSQLVDSLRFDSRVVVMEQTNARMMSPDMFDPIPELAVMDVSFISIRMILPALSAVLPENGTLISLIKPQFEAGRGMVSKSGIITDPRIREKVLKDIISQSPLSGWYVTNLIQSPITGSDGNIEYLAKFTRCVSERSTFTEKYLREITSKKLQ